MQSEVILVLGGARSGKSAFAQELASELGDRILFVATGTAMDEEMRHRIELHQKTRPASWRTIEVPTSVGQAIARHVADADVVLLDCMTLLAANVMGTAADPADIKALDEAMATEIGQILQQKGAHLIIVSNEVGMGLVPVYPSGRAFRDLLGRANQLVADRADRVYLLVAGIPQNLKGGR
jgi:adenosylcobinamide kinase/adenosylcobinamide-phosphate guanylyltransferase